MNATITYDGDPRDDYEHMKVLCGDEVLYSGPPSPDAEWWAKHDDKVVVVELTGAKGVRHSPSPPRLPQ